MPNTRKGKPRFDYRVAAGEDEMVQKDRETNFDEKLDNALRRIEINWQRRKRYKQKTANAGQTNENQSYATPQDVDSSRDDGYNQNNGGFPEELFVNAKIDNDNIAMILNPSNITGTETEKRQELVTRLCAVSARIYQRDARVYYCKVCNKFYMRKPDLTEHMLSAHAEHKQLLCDTCGKKFGTAAQLRRHIRDCHVTHGSEFTCRVCSRTFTLRADLNAHFRIHGIPSVTSRKKYTIKNKYKYRCNMCSKFFNTQLILLKHKASHHGIKPFSCKNCSKTFQSPEGLKKHLVIMHGASGDAWCNRREQKILKTPLRNKETIKEKCKYPCNICSRVFSTQLILQNHKATHPGVRPFVCKHCSKSFRSKYGLNYHLVSHSTSDMDKAHGRKLKQ